MYFTTLNIDKNTSQEDYDPHRHNYFEMFVFSGKGNHLIDFDEYSFEQNTIQLVCPKQIHLLNRPKDTYGFVVKFDELFIANNSMLSEFYQALILDSSFKAIQTITDSDFQICQQLYQQANHPESNLFAQHSLLLYLTSLLKVKTTVFRTKDTYQEFLSLLETNYRTTHSVEFYSSQLMITRKKLNTIVKENSDLSTKQFIQERVLLEAKRLLLHGKLSIKEIAYDLNFKEPSHFSNFFKKATNISPNEFREQIVQNENYQSHTS